MGLSKNLSCEAGSFSHCLNPHRSFQSEVLDFISLHWNPGLLCLVPQFSLPVYPHANVGLPSPPVTALLAPVMPATTLPAWPFSHRLATSSPPWLPVSAPLPTCQDECFFFNSLVVGLPYSLIFWQFWLFFVFKFGVVFLLVI